MEGGARIKDFLLTILPFWFSTKVRCKVPVNSGMLSVGTDFSVNALKCQEDAVMEEISINYRKKMDISSILEYPKLNFMKLSTDLSTAYTQENNVRNA